MASERAIDCPTHLAVDEAQRRIVELCAPRRLSAEDVPLDRALGRVLAADVVAQQAIPPFANSAMDGYALRGEDLPRDGEKRFRVNGVLLAGGRDQLYVDQGECVRITTGAPLPAGADTVVMKERVRVEGDKIVVGAGETSGSNVRPAGEDYAIGDVALSEGERITAARLGVLASCGRDPVSAYRQPRIALFVTGDELVPPGTPLGRGQIHDSNRYSLGALLRQSGIEPERSVHIRDDPAALRDALRDASETCDVVISSGGVSAGEADHFPRVVAELGKVHFWKVRMKPGMPFLCGEVGRAMVFALPGNPVSSFATFLMLVRPGLAMLQGAREADRSWRARLAEPIRKKHDRTEFLRARLQICGDGSLEVAALDRQGSGMLRGVAEADCLIVVPEAARELARGDVVDVVYLPGLC